MPSHKMKAISLLSVASVGVASAAPEGFIGPRDAVQKSPEVPIPNALTTTGCFSAQGSLEKITGYAESSVSSGFCNLSICAKMNGTTVMATKGAACYCGTEYPPKSSLADDSKCNYPCPGYGLEACGGLDAPGYFSVFNLGVEVDVPYASEPDQSSSTGSSSNTASAQTSAISSASGTPEKSANVGGIAAGVVVGVVAFAGAIGGIFFYMKRKRNKEIEEEHRRNAAVNAFMGHKPGSSGGVSITDARLDPVMAQRRLSDGSIADNQDYSRRILRVTNA